MKHPAHPGLIIEAALDDLNVSIAKAAQALGVSRQHLHKLISGKSAVTAEMALRLEKGIGSNADFWLRLQAAHDLAQIRNRDESLQVSSLIPKVAAE